MSWNVCGNKGDPVSNAALSAKNFGLPLRVIDPADVVSYAHRSGAKTDNQLCYTMACLLTGRILYAKSVPGDCPTKTSISLGPAATISKGIGAGTAALGAASSISLAATGGAGIGASAGGSGVALGGLPSIFGAIAGPIAIAAIPLAIWATISAHHKIAVAREQATICDFSQAYNEWEAQIEAGILSGQLVVSDAKNAVPQVEAQLTAGLKGIYKDCNAACFETFALRALNLYAIEKLYDSLGTPVASSTSSLFGRDRKSVV